jgi:REG-2-like HAD superfamily hydrolase
VFLDVGDTLLRAHPSWSSVYLRVLRDHGLEVDERALREALDRTFGADVEADLEHGFEASPEASYARLKAFDERVLGLLGARPQPDAFFRSLEATFAERSSWWVFPDVPVALSVMRAAGCRLAVISNWGWSAPELLHTLELAAHFEAIVVSDRVGYVKPHRGIFEHALGIMAVPAERAVHVGDSLGADIAGARAVGIQPVLIDRHLPDAAARERREREVGDVPLVTDLLELLDLLRLREPSHAAAT